MNPPSPMHTRTHSQPSIRYRHSDFQNLVAAEVTRLKPPGDQSLLTSAATVFDAAPPSAAAFTRAELLITLAVLSLLAAIVLPALAHDRARSARIICANNLRQIGAGFQLWSNDHGDRPPWEIAPADGGTKLHPLGVNAWLHFSWISNELNSARVLLCPSDSGKLADTFSFSPTGGYLNANYRNTATSYYLSHAFMDGQFVMFAGDRNLITDSGAFGCSVFSQVNNVGLPALQGWDTNLHNQAGNIVRLDGRVNQYSNEELRSAVRLDPIGDRGDRSTLHILKPR